MLDLVQKNPTTVIHIVFYCDKRIEMHCLCSFGFHKKTHALTIYNYNLHMLLFFKFNTHFFSFFLKEKVVFGLPKIWLNHQDSNHHLSKYILEEISSAVPLWSASRAWPMLLWKLLLCCWLAWRQMWVPVWHEPMGKQAEMHISRWQNLQQQRSVYLEHRVWFLFFIFIKL